MVVNGERRVVPAGQTLFNLLEWLGIVPDRVAVELDKSIVRKRDWPETMVSENAQIEIVEFVGGG